MQTQIYLFFDGRTDEALEFYKKTLGIEVEMLMRFKDAPGPDDPNCPPPPKPERRHALLALSSAARRIMASDGHVRRQAGVQGFRALARGQDGRRGRQAVRRD